MTDDATASSRTRAIAAMAAMGLLIVTAKLLEWGPALLRDLAGVALMLLAGVLLGRRSRASRGHARIVWALMAGGAVLNGVAEGTWVAIDAANIDQDAVSIGPDTIYLLSYPLMIAGMWRLITAVSRRGAWVTAPEAAGFLIVVGFALWQAFVAYPDASDAGIFQRVVLTAYPLLDALLLTMAVWFMLATRGASLASAAIAAFAALVFAADVLYGLSDLLELVHTSYPDALFALAFTVLALSGLLPGDLLTDRPSRDTVWRSAVSRARSSVAPWRSAR